MVKTCCSKEVLTVRPYARFGLLYFMLSQILLLKHYAYSIFLKFSDCSDILLNIFVKIDSCSKGPFPYPKYPFKLHLLEINTPLNFSLFPHLSQELFMTNRSFLLLKDICQNRMILCKIGNNTEELNKKKYHLPPELKEKKSSSNHFSTAKIVL